MSLHYQNYTLESRSVETNLPIKNGCSYMFPLERVLIPQLRISGSLCLGIIQGFE